MKTRLDLEYENERLKDEKKRLFAYAQELRQKVLKRENNTDAHGAFFRLYGYIEYSNETSE